MSSPPPAAPLAELGFTPRWESLFAPHAGPERVPARVIRTDRGSALVATALGVRRAAPAASLRKRAACAAELPAVGDWVALFAPAELEPALIEAVLERQSAIVRGAAGGGGEAQVLSANVDVVFVVAPIAAAPNLRRIERELTLAWESGARPVVVLTKADLSSDPEAARAAVETVAYGVDILLTSALSPETTQPLAGALSGGRTAVLIGPSGAGKSTLVNALLGTARQATREVRLSDGRGRHATVARELFAISGGGLLIDTPGLRELTLLDVDEGLAATFPEIERAAGGCRFRDCRHGDEPGCAVRAAVAAGELPTERLASYQKLVREAEAAERRSDARLRAEQERQWKIIHRAAKQFYKLRGQR